MSYATAAALVGGQFQRRFKDVYLPVRQVTVRIRSLNEREVSVYQNENTKPGGLASAAARLAVLTVCDENGNPVLTREHIPALQEWDSLDAETLWGESARFVGIIRPSAEELAKNFAATGDGEQQ